jgi:hypothetical protein
MLLWFWYFIDKVIRAFAHDLNLPMTLKSHWIPIIY